MPKAKTEFGVRLFHLGEGVPELPDLQLEIDEYVNVLLGRKEPPIDNGVMTLMEVASAYYARAAELTLLLQRAERNGIITRGSRHYRFRTGELRTFMDLAKSAMELGSRRVTVAKTEMEMLYG